MYRSRSSITEVLRDISSFSAELGLDLKREEDRLKWFIASILFAKRISATIAKRTFRRLMDEGLADTDSILKAGWDRLVEALDSGGYVRYDFSTATNILENIKRLKLEYRDLERLHEEACNSRDLESKLMEFRGFGPTAVNIFLRELRGIWSKADPKPSSRASEMAEFLGLETREVEEFESSLIRIHLEFCKKSRCMECPVRVYCERKLLKSGFSARPARVKG
ncbi:MAG: hypothetical protein QXE79_00335 [Candidatus Bathyarchaeia archaeon]